MECGLIYGAARRKDGVSSIVFEPESEWVQPIYACASTAKAVIRTVNFRFNGTTDLANLAIDSIKDKEYTRLDEQPIWGVENSKNQLQGTNAFWGLVDPLQTSRINITTIRSPVLRLPGLVDPFSGGSSSSDSSAQNAPGAEFYIKALSNAFGVTPGGSSVSSVTDYSGKTSLALYKRWQDLSQTPAKAARMIDLIWTDVAANAVVGTRGHIAAPAPRGSSGTTTSAGTIPPNTVSKRDDAPGSQNQNGTAAPAFPVIAYRRQIRYHLRFAIPAVLALATMALLFGVTFFMLILGRAGPTRMRRFFNLTAAGRIWGFIQHPNSCPPGASTGLWANAVGRREVQLGRLGPAAPVTDDGASDIGLVAYGKNAAAGLGIGFSSMNKSSISLGPRSPASERFARK